MGTIRAIRPDEVDELFAMICELAEYEKSRHEVQSSAEDFRVALFGPNPQLFGLVVDTEGDDTGPALGGFAVWYVNFSTWSGKHGIYLEDLYVRPQHRGSGLGKALLAALADECVKRGLTRLQWWVLDWNEPSIGFYHSLGAQAMDEWTVMRISGPVLTELAGGA